MTTPQLLKIFQLEDILDLPTRITEILEGDLEDRDRIYLELLEANNYDLSNDFFQETYEEELAQRSKGKQDFTPNTVSIIASRLTGQKGAVYEPTAGNGGMLIIDWWERCLKASYPIMHFPGDNMFTCWELSNRSLPILLLNLSIRGMMGYVYHGDVLTQEIKCKYILLNRKNDTLAFSEIIKDPENRCWINQKTGNESQLFKPFKNIY